jgi:DNA-binding transcriptional MerR regulator
MRISEMARNAGVSVQTLRFYERLGVLPQPARTSAGYRRYDRRDLARVRFIKNCQATGFTLQEVRELFVLHRALAGPGGEADIKPKARLKLLTTAVLRLAAIDDELRILNTTKRKLKSLIMTLRAQERLLCPVSRLPAP